LFFFNSIDQKVNDIKCTCLKKLNKIFKGFLQDSKIVVIISDASIKNNVATSITHTHCGHNIMARTIYHAVNITSTEVELFTIRCGINQAIHVTNMTYIIVITDAIHLAKKIFDLLTHSYQVQFIAIV